MAKVALPAVLTEPTSVSSQTEGRVGFGAAVTVRESVLVLVKPLEVPVIVRVAVPVVAVLLAVRVRVLVVVAGLGLKEAVTPLGKPEADRLMLPEKPL